ncbi:MAG TPA: iron-containing alcohol dehydrogenase [Spirochaetia bacterium]|nr:iron-containing alcohol dehydrogenase [Spirochaetia bacterium]
MLPDFLEFKLYTRIIGGDDVLESLGDELAALGITRLFVVTDAFLRETGLVEGVLRHLAGSRVEIAAIFDQCIPNSDVILVEEGARRIEASGADGLLAIGGGSNIDTAKAMNLVHTLGGRLLDHQGAFNIEQPMKLPLVVIPTTAGTGSEVTLAAVIRDREERAKITFFSPHLAPRLALLVPSLTRDLPPSLTAATGFDALSHAVEAYVSVNHNPFTDALALEAMRYVQRYLVRVVTRGGVDMEARWGMLVAATMAGMSFNVALLGGGHAIAHAIGGLFEVPHGVANALVLPAVCAFNLDACPERFRDIAEGLGVPTGGMDPVAAGTAGIAAMRALREACGLPATLAAVNIPAGRIPDLADLAEGDGSIVTNPKPLSAEDITVILESIAG